MKNIIITILLGIIGITVVNAADLLITQTRNFTVENAEGYKGWSVTKFVDPDNGYVCYLSQSYFDSRSGGISCIK